MTTTLSIALIINAVFALVVWPPFWRRVVADERAFDAEGAKTKFYKVHAVLIGTALLIALVSLGLGIAGLFAG